MAPLRPFAVFVLLALAGCATSPPASEPEALAAYKELNDPLQPTNRVLYEINNDITAVTLTPVADAYRWALPERVRNGVANLVANFDSPILFANDVLEAKPRRAGDTFMRFLINSTIGLGGIFDVASGWGYPAHPADFGMTLAVWGVPQGPYLFVPIIGPSNPRDAAGFVANELANPMRGAGTGAGVAAFQWSMFGLTAVSRYAGALPEIRSIKRTALDPYATLRSLFRQHRAAEIKAAKVGERRTIPVWFSLPKQKPSE
ncbi:MAG: MlaA family lipoprotein [Acetobacteraceae bacterium]